jgi:DNA-directed RNA polymerase specialized sigma24 family protein
MTHSDDILLAQRCLDGAADAISSLHEEFGAQLIAFLIASGGSEAEARDIVRSLWTDCSVGSGKRLPRFWKYHGQCALILWLKAVALNELIDQKRRAARHCELSEGALAGATGRDGGAGNARAFWDAPLFEIMREAILSALAKCPPQEMVMLQLVHINGLTQRELTRLWGWHESKISRALDAAMEAIASNTLHAVRRFDPWLDLAWPDLVDLCRYSDFSICC